MLFKKLILIALLLFVFPNQYSIAQETKTLCSNELLRQRIKSITETVYRKAGAVKTNKHFVTIFNDQGAFEFCVIGDDREVDPHDSLVRYFDNKYVKPQQHEDTTGCYYVDKFNANGEKSGSYINLKNDNLYCRNEFKFGKYNMGNITELCIYNSKDSLVFKQGYLFNNKDLLTEVSNYSGVNRITDRTIYKYTAYDKNGNWIKRVEIKKSPKGKITSFIETYRKIVYD